MQNPNELDKHSYWDFTKASRGLNIFIKNVSVKQIL